MREVEVHPFLRPDCYFDCFVFIVSRFSLKQIDMSKSQINYHVIIKWYAKLVFVMGLF